jgi:SAM-dependent methyltransferase
MAAATAPQGSAHRNGPLWGTRAGDWALNEDQQLPTYEAAITRVGLTPGQRVLEVGCGTGVFLRAAADRGAEVHGLDASGELLALARERVPEADLRTGDMQFLPYDDDSFDVVAGFNSFFFADDIVAALREAGRAAKPGAPVVIQVWGREDRCDLTAMKQALAPFRPPPAKDQPPPLCTPGVLEGLASAAGLTPGEAFDVSWAYDFPDQETMVRALLAPGPVAAAAATHGDGAMGDALVATLGPYRQADGGYRLENEWHFLLARA